MKKVKGAMSDRDFKAYSGGVAKMTTGAVSDKEMSLLKRKGKGKKLKR